MTETLHMPLIDEGAEVWRPIEAERQPDGLYLVLGPVPYGETWAFPPGALVRCEARRFADGREGLAAIASD